MTMRFQSQGTVPARDSREEAQSKQKKVALVTTGVTALVAGVGLGVIIAKEQGCIEGLREDKPACSAPKKGDLRCEVDKGEANPFHANFDLESCGYCGDGIQQKLAKKEKGAKPEELKGTKPKEVDGVMVQEVTDEARAETEASCPVDFLCGNGKQDKGVFGAFVKNDDGTWTLGTKAVKETRETCGQDFPKRSGRPSGRPHATGGRPHAKPAGGLCKGQLKDNILGSSGGKAWFMTVTRAVLGKAGDLRDKLKAGSADLLVNVDANVDGLGNLSGAKASGICGGKDCPGSADIIGMTNLKEQAARAQVGAPGIGCRLRIPVRVK